MGTGHGKCSLAYTPHSEHQLDILASAAPLLMEQREHWARQNMPPEAKASQPSSQEKGQPELPTLQQHFLSRDASRPGVTALSQLPVRENSPGMG